MKKKDKARQAAKAGQDEEYPGRTAVYAGLYEGRIFHYDGVAVDIIRTDLHGNDFS